MRIWEYAKYGRVESGARPYKTSSVCERAKSIAFLVMSYIMVEIEFTSDCYTGVFGPAYHPFVLVEWYAC